LGLEDIQRTVYTLLDVVRVIKVALNIMSLAGLPISRNSFTSTRGLAGGNHRGTAMKRRAVTDRPRPTLLTGN